MFRALFIAAGVGVTVWCIYSQQPTWVVVFNVVVDVFLILSYIRDKK